MLSRKTNSNRYYVLHRFAALADAPMTAIQFFQQVRQDVVPAVEDGNAMSRLMADAYKNKLISRRELPDDPSRGPLEARFVYYMTPEQKTDYAEKPTFDPSSYVKRNIRRKKSKFSEQPVFSEIEERQAPVVQASTSEEPRNAWANHQPVTLPEETTTQALPAQVDPVLQTMTAAFETLITRSLREAVQGTMVQTAIREAMASIAASMAGTVEPAASAGGDDLEEPEATPDKPDAPRDNRPQILIAGLMPKQCQELETAYKGKLKLRFWKAEHGKNLSHEVVRNSALVVASRFVDHPSTYVMQADRSKFRLVQGGVTSIKRELNKFLETRPALGA